MKKSFHFGTLMVLVLLAFGAAGDRFSPRVNELRTPRGAVSEGDTMPNWTNAPAFHKDVFTFARIHYTVDCADGPGKDPERRWAIDSPNSDLNFSWRLQQITSVLTDPDGRYVKITDKDLTEFPFTYIVEPGRLTWTEEEIPILQRYLLNGGFLMIDDFWGEREWDNMAEQMKRVFPERDFADLPRKHPLFHCVFDLPETLNLQCPNYRLGEESQYTGVTWEREDAHDTHIRGLTDDKGRLMVVACHNTDNGDGWEREGEYHYYFKEFSEKKAYPLGINIIFYVMTH